MYFNEWSKEEVAKLKRLYPILRLKDLANHFPKRNKATIAVKALSLGLPSAKLWQKRDNELLRSNFPSAPQEEIIKLFPGRTWIAIMAQAERLKVYRNRNKPRLQINENYFTKWSSNMAYILGYILSDGCIIKGSYKGYSDALKLGVQQKDKDILEKIKKEIGSGHSISLVKNAAYLCITSQKLVDSLKTLGITYRKSLNETLPKVPTKFIKDFIRGVIDGDGGIGYDLRQYPTLRLYGGLNTVTFVRNHFWKKFKAFSSIAKIKFSSTAQNYLYNISYRSNTAKKLILYLYENAGLYLDRKYQLAIKCRSIQIKTRINESIYKKWHEANPG